MAKPKIKVLSIDGGGIRGIIPCAVLAELERLTGKPVSDMFDLMAGTSTGAILASMLNVSDPKTPAVPKYSASDIGKMYADNGPKIFMRRGGLLSTVASVFDESYSQRGLEEILKDYLGDAELVDTRTELLVTAYDIEQRKPFYFLSRLAKIHPERENFRLRDVARSTSAAPTYFEPNLLVWKDTPRVALIDGGVFANNPAMLAYTEAHELLRLKQQRKQKNQKEFETFQAARGWLPNVAPLRRRNDMFMLSLGTGQVTLPYKYEEAREWGLAKWLRPCLDILSQGVSETVDYQMQYVLPPGKDGTPYYLRISPEIPEKHAEMSDVSPENIKALQAIAEEIVAKNKYNLEMVCEMLT